ncbi:hypothetical protein C8J56DRAFT_1053604 [Mycena floridula]|nr:hypothetical protein C8J56DRAFT_1053604 [Mycena floridula]
MLCPYLSLILLNGSTDSVVKLLQSLSLADSILVCIYCPYFLYLDDLEYIRLLAKDPRLVLAVDSDRLEESDSRQWGRRLDGEEEMDMWEEAKAVVEIQVKIQGALQAAR